MHWTEKAVLKKDSAHLSLPVIQALYYTKWKNTMTEENPYYPFSLSTHKDTHSLTLTDLKWDTFEEAGFLGNGHDWNRLIEALLSEKAPKVLSNLSFDSEADMFCVRTKEYESLKTIANLISEFYDDTNSLNEHVLKYAQYK